MKRQGSVGTERLRRKALTDKAYPDEILRSKRKRMNNGGAVMLGRGGKFKGIS